MVNEADLLSKPDYLHYNQFSTRELPIPRFGRPQTLQGGGPKGVRSLAWSCDGKKVAVGSENKVIKVWEARLPIESTGSFYLPSGSRPSPHNGHVAALAFSPVDPNILLSGCKSSAAGSIVALWDLTSPKKSIAFFQIPGDVLHLAWHPSGKQFAVVSPRDPDEVIFYHQIIKDGAEEWELRDDIGMIAVKPDNANSAEINSLTFNNSGKIVCAVSNDGSLEAWAYPSEIRKQLPMTSPRVAMLRDEPSTTEDNDESPARSAASTPRSGTPDREEEPDAVESQDQAGDVDMTVEADQSTDTMVAQVDGVADAKEGATNGNGDVDMSGTNEAGPSGSSSRKPSLSSLQVKTKTSEEIESEKLEAKKLHRVRRLVCNGGSLLALGFDPLGKYLAVGGQDALLSLFDTRDWICQRTYDACTAGIRHIRFSHDGELIAAGGDDAYIAVVSVYSGATVAKFPISNNLSDLCWHPTKNWLAWATSKPNSSLPPVWYVAHQE